MIFQIQSSSDPEKRNLPYSFSPLPVKEEEVCVSEENEPSEETRCGSEENESSEETRCGSEEICVGIRLVILVLLLVLIPATITFGSEFCILPELEINTFSISNLTVSTSKVEAVWDADIKFKHFKESPAAAEVLFYDRIEGYIYYKDIDNQIAAVKGEAFNVKSNETKRVHMRLSKTESGLEDEIVKEIKKEVENGLMHFSLRVDLGVSFERWGIRWSGNHVKYTLDTYCWDLMAGVDPKLGKGRVISAKGAPCHSLL